MRNSTIVIAIYAIVGLAACGRLPDLNETGQPTGLHGRAVTEDGTPAAGLDVYLVVDGQATFAGSTDATGAFSVASQRVGPVKLVLNDAQGHGVARDLTLFSNGENRTGSLEVGPLESWPELVTIRDIGYEERVTATAADYLHPVVSADGTRAYAVRMRPDERLGELVELAIPSGAERVLLSDFLPDAPVDRGQEPVLRLIRERVLMARGSYCHNHLNCRVEQDRYFFDVETAELFHAVSEHDYLQVVASDAWFASVEVSWRVLGVNGAELMQVGLDVFSLSPGRVPLPVGRTGLADSTPIVGLDALAISGDTLVYAPERWCDLIDERFPQCPADEDLEAGDGFVRTFFTVALGAPGDPHPRASLADFYRGINGLFEQVTQDPDSLPFFTGDNWLAAKGVSLFDLDSLAFTPLELSLDGAAVEAVWRLFPPVRPGQVGLAYTDPFAPEPRYGLGMLDVETGEIEAIQTDLQVGEQLLELCQAARSGSSTLFVHCTLELLPSGGFRLQDIIYEDGERDLAVAVDYSSALVPIRRRALYIGSNGESLRLVPDPTGTFEAATARDELTGHSQIFLGENVEDEPMNQVTYLPGGHTAPVFDPAGTHIYYFALDPLTGTQQLFRYRVREQTGT